MRRLGVGLIGALILLLLTTEFALGNDNGEGPFVREYPGLSLQQAILGPACLSLPASPLDLECNPAFLAKQEKRQLRISLVGSDQLPLVNEYRERLSTNDSIGIVNKVLNQREPLVARASAGVWYQQNWWALGFVPFRGGFASSMRNPAYPSISADIYKESELFGKVGLLTADDPNLQIGFQLRYVERTFFRRQFDLLDAIGDPAKLNIDRQRVLYLEPGLRYSFDGNSWDSTISGTLTQAGVFQDGRKSTFYPVLDLGFSTSPPFAGRKLRTTTHYSNHPDVPDLFSRFRWAAIYDFNNIATVSASIGKSVAGIALGGHIDSVVLALGWKTEDVTLDQWQAARVTTILFECGLVF
jgi:hypothetical protein